ncbi:heparinase II/III family protein [Fulvivirgaceae bacterium BMA12]|uniref:Heparinase II/III family protein n=1 Tax=Agaribacillus aureus TaxID=3051825 RepID=A0ABT8L6S0_9BACT|nr:heparinase II/III family protein [Fulvivirgaceae bacterium BMA12]
MTTGIYLIPFLKVFQHSSKYKKTANLDPSRKRYKWLVYVLLHLIAVMSASAQENRGLLQKYYKSSALDGWILPLNEWIKYPSYEDRQAWEKLSSEVRNAYIKKGEQYIDFSWPSIPASSYLDFVRTGSREVMQKPYGIRQKALESLVMAELMEGKGRFMDQIINGVWAYCEQTYWGLSAHLNRQQAGLGLPDANEQTIDLGAGKVGTDLAWIYYFFRKEFDKINPLINQRLKEEITDKILTPFYTRNDFWWMGFNTGFVNNWNPWCNYNVLNCILLIEDEKKKQILGIRKVMRSVDEFINYYHDDGGCEEGPSYWGHAGGKLFDVLELLYQVSGGKITLYDDELVKNIGRYIHRAYIADPYFINFADAAGKIHTRPGVIYRYGKRINDAEMMGFGSFLADQYGWDEHYQFTGKIELALNNLFGLGDILNAEPKEPLSGHFWLPGTQIMGARDKPGSTDGFYFAAKGGYNAESHNHNDAGSFVLYYNGKPCIVDAGVGTYTKKTFSPRRYEIWTMQSEYHNLPLINGVGQQAGKAYKATDCRFSATAGQIDFSANIATAYPKDASVKSWIRSYQLKRGKSFKITDAYQLSSRNKETSINFLTSCKVDVTTPGKVKLEGEGFSLFLHYNASNVAVVDEPVEINDNRLKKSWPDGLTRLIFSFKNIGLVGKNTFVISE